MSIAQVPTESLRVPDRFEGLRDAGSGTLRAIIAPVHESLKSLDRRFVDMRAAGRGSFIVLRGETGAGKSTFLDTVGLFRVGVVTERIAPEADIPDALRQIEPATGPRLLVLEGREALGEVSREQLEAGMHAINSFVRSDAGKETVIVWPANTDDLAELLAEIAQSIGAEALLGVDESVEWFSGPPQPEFVGIAERTVAALNEGASLAALGISAEHANELTAKATTIGRYLALIRGALIENETRVRGLLPREQYKVWTLVIAGNDPEGDVAALTRSGYAQADIDRLMTATGANIVAELKKHPEQLGILGSVLDARILHMDMVTVLAVAREYGSETLHAQMQANSMSVAPDASAAERLTSSELGLILSGASLGTRKRGSKPGGGTQTAFKGLASIARSNDSLCNAAIGAGLQSLGLIDSYETERDLGTELVFKSDLYCLKDGAPLRIEVMWRTSTGRAEIANYVLGKLGNYARAIGLF